MTTGGPSNRPPLAPPRGEERISSLGGRSGVDSGPPPPQSRPCGRGEHQREPGAGPEDSHRQSARRTGMEHVHPLEEGLIRTPENADKGRRKDQTGARNAPQDSEENLDSADSPVKSQGVFLASRGGWGAPPRCKPADGKGDQHKCAGRVYDPARASNQCRHVRAAQKGEQAQRKGLSVAQVLTGVGMYQSSHGTVRSVQPDLNGRSRGK